MGDGQTLASDDVVDQPFRRGQPVRLGEDLEAAAAVGHLGEVVPGQRQPRRHEKGRRTPGRTRHRSGGGQVQRSPSRGCQLVRPRRRRRSTGRSRCGRSARADQTAALPTRRRDWAGSPSPPRGSRGATSRTAAVLSRSGSCASRSPPTRRRCRRGPPGLRRRSRPGAGSTRSRRRADAATRTGRQGSTSQQADGPCPPRARSGDAGRSGALPPNPTAPALSNREDDGLRRPLGADHLSCSRWCCRSWGRRGRSRPAASGRRTACSRGRRCGRPWTARSGWACPRPRLRR